MSIEFRQRTPGEYARIIWNRKWLIILPTLAIATSIAYVVYHLPSVYESSSLIIVRPPNISKSLVPNVSDVDISLRLSTIDQQVKSRSSLEPIIVKYDLYDGSRTKEPMEVLIERMRKDMRVEIDVSRDITNAFRIFYRGHDPKVTQKVTADLASKYIDAQTKDNLTVSESTKNFFKEQLANVKKELDAIDRRRLEFMQQNINTLPSGNTSLIGQLTGLRDQQRTLTIEIGRMRDQRNEWDKQLSELKTVSQLDIDETVTAVGDPKKSAAYVELRHRKVQVEAELNNMKLTLKPKNPDVIKKQAELDAIKQEMDSIIEEEKLEAKKRVDRVKSRPDLRISSLESSIKNLDSEMERQKTVLSQIEGQISEIELRINSVPGVSIALEGLDREYNLKKTQYDEILERQRMAEMTANLVNNSQGETMQVIDPANFPQSPVSPKRPVLMGMGLCIGLAVGLFLAIVFELPRLLTVQSVEDVEYYTGLPVILAMPELLTPAEERYTKQRHILAMCAGIVVTALSIPLLTVLLNLSRIFDRFVA
jgi:polysaccharide chain length determinant protein (PEP-CTERM system associated)